MKTNDEIDKMLSRIVSETESKLDKLNIEEQDEYVVGLKTAYVEVLEIIQKFRNIVNYGLDYNIEVKYPLLVTSTHWNANDYEFPHCPF